MNLSTFRAIAWEGNRQVYNFLVGTGEPGRPTAPGNFKILDKIPTAYASTWGLSMPYWMGIYWAGSLENGFHGLPVNRYGQKMWGGYLGTRISYGCIILNDADAHTLFNWAWSARRSGCTTRSSRRGSVSVHRSSTWADWRVAWRLVTRGARVGTRP